MTGPSVFPDTRVTKMVGPSVFPDTPVIPKWLVLQYFQKGGYIKMVDPSVIPEKEVKPKWLVLQYFQIHGLKNEVLRPKIDFL